MKKTDCIGCLNINDGNFPFEGKNTINMEGCGRDFQGRRITKLPINYCPVCGKHMKKTDTTRAKKITVILREMIEEVEKLGRKPYVIKLTQEHYQMLFNDLKEDTDMYERTIYEIVPIGVVYYPKPTPKKIREFMGIPIKVEEQTMIVWK